MASGWERCGPAWMSLTLVAIARAITEIVPGPRFEMSPVLPSGRIAAPNGWLPVSMYRTDFVFASMIAAASASPSATSTVFPSGETATRSGHDICRGGTEGGNASTLGASLGGGTGIAPLSLALPDFGE